MHTVRLIVLGRLQRTVGIQAVEVERWRALGDQAWNRDRLLQIQLRRIQREVVIDELTEVRVPGGDRFIRYTTLVDHGDSQLGQRRGAVWSPCAVDAAKAREAELGGALQGGRRDHLRLAACADPANA